MKDVGKKGEMESDEVIDEQKREKGIEGERVDK